MMHQNKLVFAIKSNGKVLREHGDTIYIPFSSEYSLYVKNLNSVRCQFDIQIDGESISTGGFIVNANSEIEIERFVNNGNLNVGNKFKFIERIASIEKHRGIKAEDGLIRIEYEFERPAISNVYNPFQFGNTFPSYPPGVRGGLGGAVGSTGDWLNQPLYSTTNASFSSDVAGASATSAVLNNVQVQQVAQHISVRNIPVNDAGITVKGEMSNQKFKEIPGIISDGQKHVMVMKLLGELNDMPITKPVTVKHKPMCINCGTVNKPTAKFCSECGTGLEIFL
jgi:hypothetical protein